jgi:hypothetical protein
MIETDQMIENLVLNADDGEVFDGLRYREASRYQLIAWNNCRGVRIDPDRCCAGFYCAVVVFWGMNEMTPTKPEPRRADAFAVPLQPDTQLGMAILIAVDEEGRYFPIGLVSTVGEGKELAQDDFRKRLRRLELGEDPGISPYEYTLWAQGSAGTYGVACVLDATSL